MATVRDAVLCEPLLALPKGRHYAAMMIANALAVASQEHQSGGEEIHAETERLVALVAGLNTDAQCPGTALRLREASPRRLGRDP